MRTDFAALVVRRNGLSVAPLPFRAVGLVMNSSGFSGLGVFSRFFER
jgi:hypothetical protein